jgi:hypothetical protein
MSESSEDDESDRSRCSPEFILGGASSGVGLGRRGAKGREDGRKRFLAVAAGEAAAGTVELVGCGGGGGRELAARVGRGSGGGRLGPENLVRARSLPSAGCCSVRPPHPCLWRPEADSRFSPQIFFTIRVV